MLSFFVVSLYLLFGFLQAFFSFSTKVSLFICRLFFLSFLSLFLVIFFPVCCFRHTITVAIRPHHHHHHHRQSWVTVGGIFVPYKKYYRIWLFFICGAPTFYVTFCPFSCLFISFWTIEIDILCVCVCVQIVTLIYFKRFWYLFFERRCFQSWTLLIVWWRSMEDKKGYMTSKN